MTSAAVKWPVLLHSLFFFSQRRAENATYILIVVAENSLASPPLSSNVTVHVFVYDVSDQTPQFTQSEYKAMIAESVTAGTTVIKINVTKNEKVKYIIIPRIINI